MSNFNWLRSAEQYVQKPVAHGDPKENQKFSDELILYCGVDGRAVNEQHPYISILIVKVIQG